MNFPARIFSMGDTSSPMIAKALFDEARSLYERDDFPESVKLLQSALDKVENQSVHTGVSVTDALILLGWNFVALRDFDALEDLERTISTLGIEAFPEFELIRIWIFLAKGKVQDALQRSNEFLENQKACFHPLHPDFLMIRGYCFSLAGEAELPVQDYEAAYAIFNIQARILDSGRTANFFGLHLFSVGQYQKAKEWLSRAETIFDNLDLPRKKAVVALNLGLVHYKLGEFPQSLTHLEKSLRIGIEGDWIHRQCFANIALGNVYRMKRDFKSARRHLMSGYQQAQEMSQAREEALALEFLGDVYRDEGKLSEAQRCYSRTLDIIKPLAPEGDIVSEVHRRIGECHALNVDFSLARHHLRKALELTRRQGDRFEEAVTLRVMAEADQACGKRAAALEYIALACGILEEIGANYELAIARFRHAEIVLAGRNDETRAALVSPLLDHSWQHATESLKLFLQIGVPWWIARADELVKEISALRVRQEKADHEQAAGNISGQGYNPGNIIIHNSSGMRQVIELCDIYAPNDNPVLIHGETGTGKELIARRLHEKSGRTGKMVSVNAVAISPSLFEREFFGHIKGSFSGADANQIGFAEQADGGTLFLDEIGELPLDLQPKLLRLLQNGAFHAVGDPAERFVNIRLVAATNMDLYQATLDRTFREDLFYRLQVLSLQIPALKDRPDDILPLLRHFLSLAADRPVEISEFLNPVSETLAIEYPWPGNVREIISVCQQLYLQVATIGRAKVGLGLHGVGFLSGPGYLEMEETEGRSLDSIRDPRQRLMTALHQAGGNRTEAARLLNISRSSFYRQMKFGK